MSHAIEPDQVYVACYDSAFRVRVLDHEPGAFYIPEQAIT